MCSFICFTTLSVQYRDLEGSSRRGPGVERRIGSSGAEASTTISASGRAALTMMAFESTQR